MAQTALFMHSLLAYHCRKDDQKGILYWFVINDVSSTDNVMIQMFSYIGSYLLTRVVSG